MRISERMIKGAAMLAVAAGTLAMAAAGREAAAPRLKYVVILSRHGVRSPTWTAERLHRYSAEPWPDFGVAPGDLTPHGAALMRLMGAYYGEWLAGEGLVSRKDCADASRVYVWADTDQRTLETGRALARTVLPGCNIAVHSLPEGTNDPLFDPITAGAVKPDLDAALKAVRDRAGANPDQFLMPHRDAFRQLQHVLIGDGASKEMPFAIEGAPGFGVASNGKSIEISGPLATASTMTENLLLEYANGFQGAQLGWGRLTADQLEPLLQLHTLYADLVRRTPAIARARGALLLTRVLRSIEQAASGQATPDALGTTRDAVLIVSGHDTNLSNISGMLGLTWKIAGYPSDDTPPGGALIFSLWLDADGHPIVRTRYVAQTPAQMQRADILSLASPPAMQDIRVPGCPDLDCPLETFARLLGSGVISQP